jgi:hypothetical protein
MNSGSSPPTMADEIHDFIPIRSVEWDFDAVPDTELRACLLWELAHESETISWNSEKLRWRALSRPTRWDSELMKYVPNSPATIAEAHERLQKIPEMDEETMCGKINASMSGSDFYSQVLTFGGSSTKHWLELPGDLREQLAQRDQQWMMHPRCEQARLGDLEALWSKYAQELAELRKNEKEGDDTVDAHLATTVVEPADTTFDENRTPEAPRQRLTVALTIDFHRFTDQEIILAFGDWLKSIRPCPSPVRRGKKLIDERAALDGLGIMRLLQWYRMTDDAFPDRFRRRGCRACYKLRQLAFDKFRQTFPFLPPDEKPSSWSTLPETEKMCLEIERELEALDAAKPTG